MAILCIVGPLGVFMFKNILFIFVFLFTLPAFASGNFWLQNNFASQAKTQYISSSELFWKNFLLILAGKTPALNPDINVVVKNAITGAPIVGAMVMVGPEEGKPFIGNKKPTDTNGIISFSAEELKANPTLSVTAKKDGYATFTIFATKANSITLLLQPDPDENAYGFLEGKIHGWPTGYGSRTMEMGAFLPAFRTENLLNFDPQQIVSSYTVTVDIYGERKVPGNVVFPPQDKTYIIFPVHLEKPEFAMPLPIGMNTHMAGIIGAVPLGDAISAIKDKDFLEALNLATLTHVNWTNEKVKVQGNERFDITANQALTQKAITSNYQNIPPRLDVVAISLFDPKGDQDDFIALDVKSLKSEAIRNGRGSIKLSKLSQSTEASAYSIFTGIFDRNQFNRKKDDESAMGGKRALTGSLVKPGSNFIAANSAFLNIMQTQNSSSDARSYHFSSPNNKVANLNADFLILNVYSEKKNELTQGRTRRVIWSTVLPSEATELQLPMIDAHPILPVPDESKKERFFWEVLAVKGSSSENQNVKQILNTKATLNSLEQLSNSVEVF